MEISENREMYLLTIAKLMEGECAGLVPMNLLAENLEVTSVSANEMVRKLEEEGYLRYVPYKGVELLPKGRLITHNILRRHHLWEVFLVEKLALTPEEADVIACRLEHITPCDVADRLFEFLGRPAHSPLGQPIPPLEVDVEGFAFRTLSEVPLEEVVEVAQVAVDGPELAFLKEEGLCPGAILRKIATGSHADLLVETEGRKLQIGAELAQAIFVSNPQSLS